MLDAARFVERLGTLAPSSLPVVAAHLEDNDGELLLHLLLPELLRKAVNDFNEGQSTDAQQVVDAVGQGLTDGDAYVENAVAVSFVEGYGAHEGENDEFLALWPAALRRELGR